jgi:hypothetical protein
MGQSSGIREAMPQTNMGKQLHVHFVAKSPSIVDALTDQLIATKCAKSQLSREPRISKTKWSIAAALG